MVETYCLDTRSRDCKSCMKFMQEAVESLPVSTFDTIDRYCSSLSFAILNSPLSLKAFRVFSAACFTVEVQLKDPSSPDKEAAHARTCRGCS